MYAASQTVAKDMTGVKVVTADNIPENDSVTQTMQSMVEQGRQGHLRHQLRLLLLRAAFAKANPSVIVLHQGGFEKGTFPPNFGTYWGEAFEPVSLGGMAAGAATKSNKLGFVYAFPISQTIANIDAFELGAQSSTRRHRPTWSTPRTGVTRSSRRKRPRPCSSKGADVLTQHQDCQATVIDAAKAAGKCRRLPLRRQVARPERLADRLGLELGAALRGDHQDASEAGTFTGSKYNANWVGTFADNDNPLTAGVLRLVGVGRARRRRSLPRRTR